jgi:hydroxyethylthiazole kinase-like uncharacterized protein yjeF
MGTPLYRVDELRVLERSAQAQLPAGTLMARAGRAAADWITGRHGQAPSPIPICIVCGPGNNGGDGFVVAAELRARGHDVLCVLLGSDRPTTDDARAACDRWIASGGRIERAVPRGAFEGVVVDAMFGIGLVRPLAGDFLAAADWMSQQSHVVAIDLPSGLNADTGAWVGGVEGVSASATITFIGDKPGLHTAAGVDAAGIVVVEPIGVAAAPSVGSLTGADDLGPIGARRRRDTHKGSYGNVLVIGGGRGMVGAALLGGRAALRLGAGRVYVDAIGAPELLVDPVQPELMFRGLDGLADLQAIVVGCGLGVDDQARARLAAAIERKAALVADADALNLLATDPSLKARLKARDAPALLTPHPLEAARLLGCSSAEVQLDRVNTARTLAGEFKATVILKGAGSVIAAGNRYAINSSGSPGLATAGTGDVLAGMLGAFLAQGFDPWVSALSATWLHGRAADDSDIGLVAGDVAVRAAAILCQLRAGISD